MPNITIPLNDIQFSVERPVVFDIVRQLLDITQVSHKTPIMFYGDEGKAAQKNSTLSKDLLAENYWPYNEKVYIEVEEDYEKDRILSTAIRRPENLFVFKDESLGVYIKPVYSSSDVSIQFKYRATDKNQASRWRNDMRTRVSMMRDINLHELVYHYHLPKACVEIVREVHRLREAVAGYGESFEDYFCNRLTVNASVVNNLAGNGELWAVSERQIRVQGYFDFEDVPDKPEREGEHDNWTVSVNYKFKYDKPIECHMQYPMLVHQQIIDQRYWSVLRAYKLSTQSPSYTLSAKQFSTFESDTEMQSTQSNKGVSIPDYDEFVPDSILPATLRVFTAMTILEETNKRFLFNLNELGDVQLDSSILDFMRTVEYPYLGKRYNSIFCLCLYEGAFPKGDNQIYVDEQLNVWANQDLDLRKNYHVRLSLVADFSYLKDEVLARLSANPQATITILAAINAALKDCGNQKDLMKNRLSWKDIDRLKMLSDINFINLNSQQVDILVEHLINHAVTNGIQLSLEPPKTTGAVVMEPVVGFSSPREPALAGLWKEGMQTSATLAAKQDSTKPKTISLTALTKEQQLYWLRNSTSQSNPSPTPYLNQTLFVVTR